MPASSECREEVENEKLWRRGEETDGQERKCARRQSVFDDCICAAEILKPKTIIAAERKKKPEAITTTRTKEKQSAMR